MINPNSAFEEELYFQYLRDSGSVSPEWRKYFETHYPSDIKTFLQNKQNSNGNHEISDVKVDNNNSKEIIPLNSLQSRIADNMDSSLGIPTATSFRNIPVKALDENRRIINRYLIKLKRNKVSFTHILAWAIIRALIKYPNLNDSFERIDGLPNKIRKKDINLGLAVDITKKDGTRMLLVPAVKKCQNYTFPEFINQYDIVIKKARTNKIEVDDLTDASITLTNPGTIGTTASSPRLMNGQGLIIATGAIEYPTEFQAVRPEMLTKLAVSKTVTITNTYDHRIIQGAESAEFLAYIHNLLIGKEQFYDQIFASLKIPFEPIRWELDNTRINKYGDFDESELIEKGAHVVRMINAYRVRGHLLASVNPLGFSNYYYPELDPAYYGFTIWDLDRIFHADDNWQNNNMPLRDIIEILRETYCGNIGIEFMHIQDPQKKDWVKKTFEISRSNINYTKREKIEIFQKLIDAEEFENFLHTKFIGHKRFSLEGSESVIVLLDKVFKLAADSSLNSIVLGMAHRGRLNVLVNITGKSLDKIFMEFEGDIDPDTFLGSGDVKYHLGDRGTYESDTGNRINVILAPNPSHLELVDPIIEGMARALNDSIHDKTQSLNLPVLIHGDAAFAGQGNVAETLNFSQLEGFKTGGTIHIIINNQIGFTTNSQDARSTIYATDIAKMIQVPIIHVNGNDPEEVATAAKFAFDYRQTFNNDIIIDLLCYRKYGHNEGDEPSYTQPLLYKKIKSMIPVSRSYSDELIKENVLTSNEIDSIIRNVQEKLQNAFVNRTINISVKKSRSLSKYKIPQIIDSDTTYPIDNLKFIGNKTTLYPDNFHVNPKLKQLFERRRKMLANNDIDWAMAETLSFASLLADGIEIRFSGQDSRRGTFSQRHSVITDTETEEQFIPLNNIQENQAQFRIYDSPLSELSIVGFEYGYSVINKKSLVIWEAQFGDFINMAQAMIDQVMVCAEVKWQQTSGLVLLLPHGYDGQGPEHSSARLERFLQLAAEENIIVCNLTTPANYYHVLRRQALNPNKKPLIIMTPKSLLRHPRAVSSINELADGTFNKIIPDNVMEPEKVKTLVFTTGKIFYDIQAAVESGSRKDISINRIEQLYPVDIGSLQKIVKTYPNADKIVWIQEEPKNMGAWNYISPVISEVLNPVMKLIFIGRKESASTATGSSKLHQEEQTKIINDMLNLQS